MSGEKSSAGKRAQGCVERGRDTRDVYIEWENML